MIDVFSYVRQREPGTAGAVFFRFARALYVQRALPLALALPFDLAWIVVDACVSRMRRARPARFLFMTTPPAAWIGQLSAAGVGWIGAPHSIASALRYGGVYVPASPLYLLATVALFLPVRLQRRIGHAAVRLFAIQLKLAGINSGALIHHSDALPLGRAVVIAAHRLGLTTVCIQHGIFHVSGAITEHDGSLSSINVVRSQLDAELIAKAAPASRFLVEPDFFIPRVASPPPSGRARVTLLGEGWHQCDEAFGERYLARLRQLEADLTAAGLEVVFRPHPCERGLADRFGFARLDVAPLAACLAESAVVIGYSSTVLCQAASVGLSAAVIDVDGAFNPSMDRNGIAPAPIRNAAEVQAVLARQAAARPSAELLLERQRVAALRVLDSILKQTPAARRAAK